jgi:hypothetical protein
MIQLDVAGVAVRLRVSHLDASPAVSVGIVPNLAPLARSGFVGKAARIVVAERAAVLGLFAATVFVRVLVEGEMGVL